MHSDKNANEKVEQPAGKRRGVSQTLDNGLEVLEFVARAPEGLTVQQVAEGLGAHRTNVARLLQTLFERDYLGRTPEGQFFVGSRVLDLVRFFEPTLRLVAQRVLQSLADQVGATSHLTVANGDEAVALQVFEPRTVTYHVAYHAGTRRPLVRGASGFAILANRPVDRYELPEVARARERGWASSSGHIEHGTWGISSPIPHGDYSDYSIGAVFLGPPSDEADAAKKIQKSAKKIAEMLV